MTESEIWKDIAGFEGFYKVSDKGRIYSVERKDSQGQRRGGRILKPKHSRGGYLMVHLYKNGKMKAKSVHRLVAETFIPNPDGLPQVNHRDEVKDNNNVGNLEWCDSKYNINYGTLLERSAQAQSKKVRAVNVKTGEVLTFNSTREAGRKGYSYENVAKACRGTYKGKNGKLIGGDGRKYKGYVWSYEEAEENKSK